MSRSKCAAGATRHASRRDILKKTATLAAAGVLAASHAAIVRAKEPAAPSAGALLHIDSALRNATSSGELPGIVAMAATENGVVYEGVFGNRRLHDTPAMTRDTVFRIASMVKLITSVAALQLVEQGKLSLDAPVPDIDPALSSPLVFEGFRRGRQATRAPAPAADCAAALADPHRRLQLPALGRRGDQISPVARQAVGGGARQIHPHAADVRSRRALAIRAQHRLGRQDRRIDQRRTAGRALPQKHFRSARHEGYRVRYFIGAARARGQRPSAAAGRDAQSRADGARVRSGKRRRTPFPAAAGFIQPRRIT